jgi:hypothetical protein
MLQIKVVDEIEQFGDIDLCSNPEAMCQHPDLRWIGAMYYWTSVVQVCVVCVDLAVGAFKQAAQQLHIAGCVGQSEWASTECNCVKRTLQRGPLPNRAECGIVCWMQCRATVVLSPRCSRTRTTDSSLRAVSTMGQTSPRAEARW